MKYKKYPTEALLEILFMLGEQHQSHVYITNNSWGVSDKRLNVAILKNKESKNAVFKEILTRINKMTTQEFDNLKFSDSLIY